MIRIEGDTNRGVVVPCGCCCIDKLTVFTESEPNDAVTLFSRDLIKSSLFPRELSP